MLKIGGLGLLISSRKRLAAGGLAFQAVTRMYIGSSQICG
jgi:hypothetical protein